MRPPEDSANSGTPMKPTSEPRPPADCPQPSPASAPAPESSSPPATAEQPSTGASTPKTWSPGPSTTGFRPVKRSKGSLLKEAEELYDKLMTLKNLPEFNGMQRRVKRAKLRPIVKRLKKLEKAMEELNEKETL